MIVKFKLGENAKMPEQNNKSDAGYDLFAAEQITILPQNRAKIETNVSWEPEWEPEELAVVQTLNLGAYVSLADRSGNALKKGLTKMGGIIDWEYRGTFGVIIYNTSNEPIVINKGDKIAQAIFSVCIHPTKLVQVNEIKETARGSNGYGSSGVAGNAV